MGEVSEFVADEPVVQALRDAVNFFLEKYGIDSVVDDARRLRQDADHVTEDQMGAQEDGAVDLTTVTFVVPRPLIGGSLAALTYHVHMTRNDAGEMAVGERLAIPADEPSGLSGKYEILGIEREMESTRVGSVDVLTCRSLTVTLRPLEPSGDPRLGLGASAMAQMVQIVSPAP